MFKRKQIIMRTIEKKDGYVYFVKEDSNDGKFKTYYNIGKDPDDPRWKETNEKKTKKESSD